MSNVTFKNSHYNMATDFDIVSYALKFNSNDLLQISLVTNTTAIAIA